MSRRKSADQLAQIKLFLVRFEAALHGELYTSLRDRVRDTKIGFASFNQRPLGKLPIRAAVNRAFDVTERMKRKARILCAGSSTTGVSSLHDSARLT
ncbi:hypothetical protein [Burkholderia lata]|uniref:hypothetical protein n=1 Tax=Burkholderia lata (strain ATCC 17760 / DSM 23089 / LMG 22485 / NCIMB 9086 / R18194 / 383) TaxID=482957 RepID=UPI001582627E|nr:hypothetical protein [Burkholderia lata]